MTAYMHKYKVGRFIFFSNLVLFSIVLVFYFINGFTNNEFSEIMKLLVPIKAVYMTALIQYVVNNKNVIRRKNKKSNEQISKIYSTVSSIMIYTHIIALILIIALFCLFNVMDFKALKSTISYFEIFFGMSNGIIISDLFQTKADER
jgi:hypothetical protein